MMRRLVTQVGRKGILNLSSQAGLDPVQEALLAEPCILVDEQDKMIGQASKRDCHLSAADGTTLLHRAFSLFVFNSKEELLMQQRSSTKITFPDMWTNTCCSHPLAFPEEEEETDALGVRRAAQRRIEIELGVQGVEAPVDNIQYLTRLLYSAPSDGLWGEHELDYILLLRANPSLEPCPEEVKAVEWVRREDLQDFISDVEARGEDFTPWFKLISKNLLPTWWRNLARIQEHRDHQTIHRY